MRWRPRRGKGANRDVIDVRGASPRGRAGGGGGLGGGMGGLPIPGGIGGLGGGAGLIVVIVIVLIQVIGGGGSGFGINNPLGPSVQAPGADNPQPIPPSEDPQKDIKDFSVAVFENVQRTWAQSFKKDGQSYDDAKLVLYSQAVHTDGCGDATSSVGPFYCPADGRVYLDLSFYDDMAKQLGAPGDFAWAYVIAHEMGHHVQDEVGTSDEVERKSREDPSQANALSVRLELQADCYAGVWGSTVYKKGKLQPGDLDEAFTATEAVGDDRLQKQATGRVNPDTFTHGTSEQRHHWFQTGYDSADPSSCDTFSADSL